MSWTSELRSGAIGQWFRSRLPHTAEVARDVDDRVDPNRLVLPAPARAGGAHAARIGGAFGQRLAFLVENAPPYFAIFGAVRAGLIGWDELDPLCRRFSSHAPGPSAAARPRGVLDRPSPSGWLDLRPYYPPAGRSSGSCSAVVADFVDRTAAYLDQHAPVGGLAASPAAERTVLRACAVLSDWEDAYRSGRPNVAPRADPGRLGAADAGALLAQPDDETVRELEALSVQAHRAGGLDQLRRLAGHPPAGEPLGHAAPVFAPDFADGDILLVPRSGAGNNVLVDVKTVRNPHDRARLRDWLHQLIGYAWMDHYATGVGTGDWRIGRVGLYFARHGVLVEWSLPALVRAMLDERAGYDHVAAEFFDVLRGSLEQRGIEVSA